MPLISTYDLRLWLGVEEGDNAPNAKLASIALGVEDFADQFTNRTLLAKTYYFHQDESYYDGEGTKYLYLNQYPVSYVSDVNVDSNHDFNSATLVASADLYWYPKEGKLITEGEYFTRGRRNVLVNFIAGYAPVVNNTHNSSVSTYPLPLDLKQVMLEMCALSFKEGMTAVHTVQTQDQVRFVQMLSGDTMWNKTLLKYKKWDGALSGRWE